MRPSDGMILVIGPRLELPGFPAIQALPSCRFHLAAGFPGPGRSESWSEIINQAQDFGEQASRDCDWRIGMSMTYVIDHERMPIHSEGHVIVKADGLCVYYDPMTGDAMLPDGRYKRGRGS